MKKAKEYAECILNVEEEKMDKMIQEVANDLIFEIKEIAEQRKIQTDSALKSILLQQIQKWKAICKIVNKNQIMLREDGFLELLKLKIPETKFLV